MDKQSYHGPLKDGAKVVIIGGGPGGCSVAHTLLNHAERLGRTYNIILYEPKKFGFHYNQCLGILSPPITDILKDKFGMVLPEKIVQRKIDGYVLHGGGEKILLQEDEGYALAVRRVDLDAFLLDSVEKRGVEIVNSRVTAAEINDDCVNIFSESCQRRADVVFGCFGMDPGLSLNLKRYTFYRRPRLIDTLVTRYECDEELSNRFDNKVQAYLPAIEGVEFAALSPKANHISAVISGNRLRTDSVSLFFDLPEVRQFLPEGFEIGDIYKGQFPCSPARGFYEDRFVTVGDAAGLIRPFKGKGINSAIITGAYAAKVAATIGISRRAFRHYQSMCNFIIKDYHYGQFARKFINFVSHHFSLGPVIRFASRNERFRWAIAMSVTGGAPYKKIIAKCLRPSTLLGLTGSFISWPFTRKKKRKVQANAKLPPE